jgi:hypothetical protein
MVTAQSGSRNGKFRNGARRNANLPYARREFKCYSCGKIGHSRAECRYNPDNKDGSCYKGTPPAWVLEWQKGPEGAKFNSSKRVVTTESEKPEKSAKEDESN